eukprot:TRINITY_DN8500_c1_g2_i3.p1 TRINITY_DN8500_c1_g2~~TRINITY_DN8500_c1_g2_i3.p1  ORF type:complete len:538 (-),score=125.63 TRINITY_DN8500_c1_g2_i3:117-1664(-)
MASSPATSGEQEDFTPGQRVRIIEPPGLQGMEGDIVRFVPSQDSFSVRLKSGSVFNIRKENLQTIVKRTVKEFSTFAVEELVAASPASSSTAKATRPEASVDETPADAELTSAIPARSSTANVTMPASDVKDGLEFTPGQRVRILSPEAMKGKEGDVIQFIPSQGSFSVRLESGSVFNIRSEYLQDADEPMSHAASAAGAVASSFTPPALLPTAEASALAPGNDEELDFAPGQRVRILAPPALEGIEGNIVQFVPSESSFSVCLHTGSIFNILTANLQDASEPPAPEAATDSLLAPTPAKASAPASGDELLEFTPGQNVRILGPSAMHGQQGEILEFIASQDSFSVRLDSGSVFNFRTENLQDASESTAAAPPAAVSVATANAPLPKLAAIASGDKNELVFTPGQRVRILAPPAMQGKEGEIVNFIPANGCFTVRLVSGSVFNIAMENLQDAAQPVEADTPIAASRARSALKSDEAGKSGTIVGCAPQGGFSVRLESGSIFNIKTDHIVDAAVEA